MENQNKVTKFDIFIIFTLVGIVPFLVQGMLYDMPTASGNVSRMFDYFNYIKVITIKFVALIIALNYILDLILNISKSYYDISEQLVTRLKSLDKKIYFMIMIIFSVILAYIFSDYKSIARFGAYERFEGIWVHFSYAIIFIYSLSFFKKEGSFKIFSYAILFSTFIVGGIGTLQYFGVNFFEWPIVKTLSYSNFDIKIVSEGSFTTMYNINTSASYSLIIMFVLILVYLLNENAKIKVISIIDFFLIFITFYNSESEASIIGLVVSILFFFIIYLGFTFINGNKKSLIAFVSTICGVMIIFSIYAFSTNLPLKVIEKITPTIDFVKWEQEGNELFFYNKEDDFIKVVTNDDNIEIYENDTLLSENEYGTFDKFTLNTGNFSDITITNILNQEGEYIIDFNSLFYIICDSQSPYIYDPNINKVSNRAETIGFENYPNTATNRGYIWSRSLPLLLERPIVGYGSDTYFEVFPNDDFVVKYFIGMNDTVVDKPHSIYLNMAINNGIFYLLGFLGIVTLVLFDKFKLLYKSEKNITKRLALTVYLSGMIAYLVNGLATDNLVVIVMMFWIYLAIPNETFEVSNEK